MVTAHAYGAVADSGKKRIDVFLVLVYIFSILIDLYNGYAQLVLEQETVIPLLYKGGMLIYCMFFIFRNSTVLKYAYVFVLCYLCCVGYWVVSGYSLTLMGVIDDLSRLVYPYVILAYFITRKSDMDKMLLLRYMMYGCLLAALVIVITSLLGVGISSYGSDYGYGSKGFFRAGNDISLLLVMGNTIVSYFLTVRSRLIYIIYGGIIAAACMMIGTTAGIIGAFANYVFLVLQLVLVRGRYTWMYKLFCVGMLVFGVPFLLNWTKDIVNTDAYTMQKFDVERILSGENRNFLKDAYMNVQEDFTFGDRVFGLGYQELGRRIGADLGLGASRVIELNQYEMTGYYGYLLGGIILLIPIVYLVKYIDDFIRRRTSFSYWMTIAIGLFVAHAFTAGHAYNSIQAMTMLIGILFLYKYRQEFGK